MRKTKELASEIKNILLNEDYDWLHVVVGPEGIGKTSYAIHFGKEVYSQLTPNNFVFTAEQFKEAIEKSEPGQVIIPDEGALMFFSGDTSTKEVKENIKILTTIRDRNLCIIICIPNFWILTRYIRQHRVKGVTRITRRGWAFYFSPAKVKQIKQDKHMLKTIWPAWDTRDSFPPGDKWKHWPEYKAKKKKYQLNNDSEEKDKTITKKDLIKHLIKSGKYSQKEIADMMNTSRAYVREIKLLL